MTNQTVLKKPASEHDYSDDVAALRSDFELLRNDLGKLRDELVEDVGERFSEFTEQANEAIEESTLALRKAGRRTRQYAKREVRHHPLGSTLAAAGIGLALGALGTLAVWIKETDGPDFD